MTLEADLDATVTAAGVTFELTITNTGAESVTLEFTSGKRADFAVFDDGQEIWRYSSGRLYTQALGEEVFEPDQAVSYEGVWQNPAGGEYTAVGELAVRDRELEATTPVSV